MPDTNESPTHKGGPAVSASFGGQLRLLISGKRIIRWNRQPNLFIEAEGIRYTAKGWSLGGFRLQSYHRPLRRKDRIEGSLALGRFGKSGEIIAEVVRVGQESGIAFRILQISPAFFVTMSSVKHH